MTTYRNLNIPFIIYNLGGGGSEDLGGSLDF